VQRPEFHQLAAAFAQEVDGGRSCRFWTNTGDLFALRAIGDPDISERLAAWLETKRRFEDGELSAQPYLLVGEHPTSTSLLTFKHGREVERRLLFQPHIARRLSWIHEGRLVKLQDTAAGIWIFLLASKDGLHSAIECDVFKGDTPRYCYRLIAAPTLATANLAGREPRSVDAYRTS
jgi:hypothetical protein